MLGAQQAAPLHSARGSPSGWANAIPQKYQFLIVFLYLQWHFVTWSIDMETRGKDWMPVHEWWGLMHNPDLQKWFPSLLLSHWPLRNLIVSLGVCRGPGTKPAGLEGLRPALVTSPAPSRPLKKHKPLRRPAAPGGEGVWPWALAELLQPSVPPCHPGTGPPSLLPRLWAVLASPPPGSTPAVEKRAATQM